MTNFKQWLFSEAVTIDPKIKNFPLEIISWDKPAVVANSSQIKAFVGRILSQMSDFRQLNSRYDIHLSNIREYTGQVTFELKLHPIGIRTPQIATKDDPLYDYYQKRNGVTGRYVHKTPKDAIEEIPVNPNYVYRGMSWEEWQYIQKTGQIQSNNQYNLGDVQNNLTFYGSAETATYYANGFAPVAFKTSLKKPSLVIAIDKKNVKTHSDLPKSIPSSEFAHIGPLSAKEIKEVWMLVPKEIKPGYLEIIMKYVYNASSQTYVLSDPREGSRGNPSIGYVIKRFR